MSVVRFIWKDSHWNGEFSERVELPLLSTLLPTDEIFLHYKIDIESQQYTNDWSGGGCLKTSRIEYEDGKVVGDELLVVTNCRLHPLRDAKLFFRSDRREWGALGYTRYNFRVSVT